MFIIEEQEGKELANGMWTKILSLAGSSDSLLTFNAFWAYFSGPAMAPRAFGEFVRAKTFVNFWAGRTLILGNAPE